MRTLIWIICFITSFEAHATVIDYDNETGKHIELEDYRDEIRLIGKFDGRYNNFHSDMAGVIRPAVTKRHQHLAVQKCLDKQDAPVSDYERVVPEWHRRFIERVERTWDGNPIDPVSGLGKDAMRLCEFSIYYKECDEHEPQEILRAVLDYGFFTERDDAWVRNEKCMIAAAEETFGGGSGMDYLYYYYKDRVKPHFKKREERLEERGLLENLVDAWRAGQ